MNMRMLFWTLFIIFITIVFFSSVNNELRFIKSPEEIILDDVKSKFPDSRYEVITSQKEGLDTIIQLYVISREETICPERIFVKYVYPRNHLTPEIKEITTGCRICKEVNCTITFPEEAVIASYLYSPVVADFVMSSKKPRATSSRVEEGFIIEWINEKGKNIRVHVEPNAKVTLLS